VSSPQPNMAEAKCANLRGSLSIIVIKAADLRDINAIEKMDPFVKVHVDQHEEHTFDTHVHKKGGTNPVWNSTIGPFVLEGREDSIGLRVYHKDTFSADDLIARCDISLLELVKAKETWFAVTHKGEKVGSIQLTAKFFDASVKYVSKSQNPKQRLIERMAHGPFMLLSKKLDMVLYVSNDKKGGDHVLEAHSLREKRKDERNIFELREYIANQWFIHCIAQKEDIFVSGDKIGGDRVVEAHDFTKPEERNGFEIQVQADGQNVVLFNPSTSTYCFLSNDKLGAMFGGDHVVEAKADVEERSVFEVLNVDGTPLQFA